MTQYPGHDPDDPFSRPPDEEGTNPPVPPSPPTPGQPGTEETAPIQGEEMGYWERKASEDRQQAEEGHQQGMDPGAQARPVEQGPAADQQPQQFSENPWAGYGQPAPTTPYQQGYGQPAQPPPPYGQPGYPAYGYPVQPPNHPRATTALVLGLVGLVGGCLCLLPLLVAPFAWVVGARTRREIAASNGQLGGEGSAQAGFVMGIIGTVLLVLAVLALIGLLVVGIASGPISSGTSTPY